MINLPYCDNGDSVINQTNEKKVFVKSVGRRSATIFIDSAKDASDLGCEGEPEVSYPPTGGALFTWNEVPGLFDSQPFSFTVNYLYRPTFAGEAELTWGQIQRGEGRTPVR